MTSPTNSVFDDRRVLAERSAKNSVDPRRPYAFLVERELSAEGTVDDVATLFLTNRECLFRCVFCDLWKNTTGERVPVGAIPEQIDFALARLPAARHIKLYNSGNFFDAQAIPPEDFSSIADRVRGFRTVIVENHPKLCGDACVRFRDLLRVRDNSLAPGGGEGWGEGRVSLDSPCEQRSGTLAPHPRPLSPSGGEGGPELEIAIGLETVHPGVLPRLNKRMTVDDFDQAVRFLRENDIAVRAFILLKPPFLDEADAVTWCLRSVEHAFDAGVGCCSIIPTRGGNGIMEQLERDGLFAPPSLAAIEQTFDAALQLATGCGRVFFDTWDIERFCRCSACGPSRAERLRQMNFTQRVLPPVVCDCTP
jgi:uncharacterized Fe-S cluster-containing MiaB family protein